MVAYSFKARFAPLIVSGEKAQTIRGHRKRHARPGEPVQLYTGMRTKRCRKIIPDPVCEAVEDILIRVPRGFEPCVVTQRGRTGYVTPQFAQADGFEGVEDFTRFWFDTHGPGLFEGVVIRWSP